MSGHSSGTECPNCGAEANLYEDRKPFDYIVISCDECGLVISPQIQYLTLKELNEKREEQDLPKLRKKPQQNKDLW